MSESYPRADVRDHAGPENLQGRGPTSKEEDQVLKAPPGASGHESRQQVIYCPYCAEETLFPVEDHGWECRSCARAFSVKFLGLRSRANRGGDT